MHIHTHIDTHTYKVNRKLKKFSCKKSYQRGYYLFMGPWIHCSCLIACRGVSEHLGKEEKTLLIKAENGRNESERNKGRVVINEEGGSCW